MSIISKNNKKSIQAVLFIIFAFLFILPAIKNLSLINWGNEQGNISYYDYEITSYDIDMNLLAGNILTVEETITANMNEYMHGIVRAIPILQTVNFEDLQGNTKSLNYKVYPTNISGQPYLDTYEEGGVFYFQFGQENELVINQNIYTLSYTLDFGDDRNTEFDQFYYNIIGNYWDTTISNVTFSLTCEKPVEEGKQLSLYVGEYGSTNTLAPITVDSTGKNFEGSYSGTLQPGQGITARMVLPEGFLGYQRVFYVEIGIAILFVVAIIVFVVLRQKNNNTDQLVPVVNFDAPFKMPPSEMGYIIDGVVDNKDIASLIVYWAQKGYLKIVNTDPENKQKLSLVKIAELEGQAYEKNIFDKIFSTDETIKIEDIGVKIFEQVARAKQSIKQKHQTQNFSISATNSRNIIAFLGAGVLALVTIRISGYATNYFNMLLGVIFALAVMGVNFLLFVVKDNQHKSKGKSLVIILFICLAFLWGGFAFVTYNSYVDTFLFSFVAIIPSAVAVICSYNINIRSHEGMKILGEILGFKQFIEFTEKDRIEMLVKDEPQIFYNILPYAYVLGVSNEWIEKFEGIAIEPPSWYQSDAGIVDYLIFRSIFNSIMLSSMAGMSYRPKMDNIRTNGIGGGFGGFGGGGGFSGGGFGGGGGRGW